MNPCFLPLNEKTKIQSVRGDETSTPGEVNKDAIKNVEVATDVYTGRDDGDKE